jgi:O-antigen/teichoic acid export membrane protein
MEREGRFREIAFVTTLTGIVGALATILLAVLHFGYMSMAYANVISSFAAMALFIWFGRDHFRLNFGLSEHRRILRFGGQMLASSGLIAVSSRAGEILLGRLVGLAALGLFNRASGLCNLAWSGIHSIISRVVLVDFARTYRTEGTLRTRYITTVAVVSAILWPAFIGMAVIARPFIVMVYGQKWEGAAMPLVYLCLASTILTMSTVAWEVCAVTDNLGVQTRTEAIRAPVSLSLLFAAAFISLDAVAFSRIIEAAVAFILYRPHLDRMTGTSLRDFTGTYLQGALLSLGAATPSYVVVHIWSGGTPSAAMLVLSVVAGITIWGGMVFALGHPLAVEISSTLRNLPRLIGSRRMAAGPDHQPM